MSTGDLPADAYYFAKLTPTDHSGSLWVVAILSLIYGLTSSGVRFMLRRGMYGLDDAAILVSTLASIVQHAFVFISLTHGLGQDSYSLQMSTSLLSEATYRRIVLAILVHCLAKISLTLFVRRLFYGQDVHNRIICNVMLAANCVWGVMSILLLTIDCGSLWYFSNMDVCHGLMTRWMIIKALDIVTELAIVFVPIILIARVLINRRHKLTVMATFAARLPVIVFSILHYIRLKNAIHTPEQHRGVALVAPVLWLQVELLWSMVTASLPSFKSLVSPFRKMAEPVSSDKSDPALNGTSIFMGPEPDQQQNPTATASSTTSQSQLDRIETSTTVRPGFKAYTVTKIVGPRKKLFGVLPRRQEQDIELGTIQHEKSVEIKYDSPSNWSSRSSWRLSDILG